MAKSKTKKFFCSNCGFDSLKWLGQCPSCKEWNTFLEIDDSVVENTNSKPAKRFVVSEINSDELSRIPSGLYEFDRVLGGDPKGLGFVKGSVVLISGDPGIGKSTLLMQVCSSAAKSTGKAVYISGEESVYQVGMRAKRILDQSELDNVEIVHSVDVDEIISTIHESKTEFAVIDSIQTVSTTSVAGIAGGIAQVRASTQKLVNFAKSNEVTLFIIGHINKEGSIAGPKLLEHLVDTVIQIEGDADTDFRIVRSLKNRFGTTNEVGILSMNIDGLQDLSDPSALFISKESVPGICKSAILEGNRIMVVEAQALISPTVFSLPKRVSEGISVSKLQLLCAIIQRYLRINLSDKDVYVKIAGDYSVRDKGIDLAICLAIMSSVSNKSLDAKLVAFGEISLTGSITQVSSQSRREAESKRLGYTPVISSTKFPHLKDLKKILSV